MPRPIEELLTTPLRSEEEFSPHPIPDVSPTWQFHGRIFRLGMPTDPVTNGPLGCACVTCNEYRAAASARELEIKLRDEYARNKADAERRVRDANTVRTEDGEHIRKSCAYCGGWLAAICSRCGMCTQQPHTLQFAIDLCVLFPRVWQEVTPLSKVQSTYDSIRATAAGETAEQKDATARRSLVQSLCATHHVNNHCQCYDCASCHTPHTRCRTCDKPDGCPDEAQRCDCWVCPADNRRHPYDPYRPHSKCEDCEKYLGCCCRCVKCPRCGIKQTSSIRGRMGGLVENRCQSCRCCIACCKCAEEKDASGVVMQRGVMKHIPATSKWGLLGSGIPHKGQLNPFTRLIGQEIECGGNGTRGMNQVVVQKWGGCIVEDGSLPVGGFEINTAPAGGDKFVEQIRDIVTECQRTGVWVNHKCGLHTHVDTSDFNIWAMRRLINLYRRAEPHLFSMLPSTRIKNNYCQPCGDSWWTVFNTPGKIHELKSRTVQERDPKGKFKGKKKVVTDEVFHNPASSLKGKLTDALYGYDPATATDNRARKSYAEEIKRAKGDKGNSTRYRALNVHSWMLRGTLEFRHGAPALELHHNTGAHIPIKGDYIINWGIVCAGLVEAAARMSDAEVDALGAGKSSGSNANMTWDEFKGIIVPSHLGSWADETKKVCQTAMPSQRTSLFTNEMLDCGCRYNGDCHCDPQRRDYDCILCD